MKKGGTFVALASVLSLLVCQPTTGEAQNPFTDIGSSYAQKEILDLYSRGIVTGKGQGLFEPYTPITRVEFVTMLGRLLGVQPLSSAVPAFRDVSPDYWGYPWVQAGVSLGIVSGTGPDAFQPEVKVTRQEVAALMVRALERSKAQNLSGGSLPFADSASIAPWARPFVAEANQLGLMHGDAGGFRPGDPITREETSVVLDRVLNDPKWTNAQPVSGTTAKVQLGWQYDATTEEFERRVSTSDFINTVAPRWFFLEGQGLLSDGSEPALVSWSHQNGKKVWALVGNHFSPDLTHQNIGTPEARQVLIEQLVTFAADTYHVDGLNIDFEGFYPEDRDNYTAFIAELGTAMHDRGLTLSVDVPPSGLGDWSDPFDYAALGSYADYVVLMGYDEHWYGDPKAGSVSSLGWYTRAMQALVQTVPASKVIAGLPLYTRDWYTGNGKMISVDVYLPAQTNILQKYNASKNWDSTVGQYVASYSKSGVTHQMWVEDGRSLAQKFQVGVNLGVGGNAYWHVGAETPDVWTSLKNLWNFKQYQVQ